MENVVKKSFIIAAACLVASISWAAEVTFTMSDIFDGQKLSFDVTSPVSAKVTTNTSKGNAPSGNDEPFGRTAAGEDRGIPGAPEERRNGG